MNDDTTPHFLTVTSVLDGSEVRLLSLAMPALDSELSDHDRADQARVDIVLSDGTGYFGMVPRKAVASLQGTTVEYNGEPLNIEKTTIAAETNADHSS